MKDNYFLIHGSYGNPYKNWFPWLKKELAKRRLNCIVPSFTTPFKQDYQSWSKLLSVYLDLGYINKNTIFITHSLGGIFIIKFLLEFKVEVKKVIIVAGFNCLSFDDDMQLYQSFYVEKKRLSDIKKYCQTIISFYSNNDPYIPLSVAEEFSNDLDAEKVLIKEAGHFNEKSGYSQFKKILEYI